MGGEIVPLLDRLLIGLLPLMPAGAVAEPRALRHARLGMLGVLRRFPVGILVRLRLGILGCGLRIRRRRLPIVGLLVRPTRLHRRAGAGDSVRAAEPDQPTHRCQIDPPSAIDRWLSPAHRGTSTPKQREQVVKHVGYPAPEPGSAVSTR